MSAPLYHAIADLVLLVHVGFVAFVVAGLVLILAGGVCSWRWVRNPWFRLVHLLAIVIVVLQSWLGMVCPLTDLEMFLRDKAGDSTYQGTFIAHWLQKVLYFDAPPWCFLLGYTLFGLLTAATWLWIRPDSFNAARKKLPH